MSIPTIKKTRDKQKIICEVAFPPRTRTYARKEFYNTDNILEDLKQEIEDLNLVLIEGHGNIISNSPASGYPTTAIWVFEVKKAPPRRTKAKSKTPQRKKGLTNSSIRGRMSSIAKAKK